MQALPIATSLGYPQVPPVSKLPPILCPSDCDPTGWGPGCSPSYLSPLHCALAHSFIQGFFQFLDYVRFFILCLDHYHNQVD